MTLQKIKATVDDGTYLYVMREFAADSSTVLGAATLTVRRDEGYKWFPMSVDWHLPEAQYAASFPGRACMALGERCQSDGSCTSADSIWDDFLRSGNDVEVIWRELEGWLPRWGYPTTTEN